MTETRDTLSAGERRAVGGLILSVARLDFKSHGVAHPERSAPAMTATTIELRVERGEDSDTLVFLQAEAGFATTDTQIWGGHRLQLEGVTQSGAAPAATFLVTPLE